MFDGSCFNGSGTYRVYVLNVIRRLRLWRIFEGGEYKGLSVAPYTVTVSIEDIYTEIENRLQEAAETSELEKGEAVEDGDTVNIDYVGRIDGKKFDNGSAEGQSLQIGSNSFIEGFEEGLIGKTVGSEAVLEVTFPEDYSEESLQGKMLNSRSP